MQTEQNKADNFGKLADFISKWALIVLVLTPYLFLQIKILYLTLNHPTEGCGMWVIGAFLGPIILFVIAALILFLRLYLGKGFTLIQKLSIFLLVFVPPLTSIITLSL